jgi:hypothetical protein
MLEESGMKSSRSMAPAESVAKAVVRVIAKDRAELVVMPGPGRLMRAVLDYFPALGPAINRAVGATTAMRKIVDKRHERANAAAA